jgi:hypothetical protein
VSVCPVLSRPVADDRIPDDTLEKTQHIWNIKPRNPEQFFLVVLPHSPISLPIQAQSADVLVGTNHVSVRPRCDQDLRPLPLPRSRSLSEFPHHYLLHNGIHGAMAIACTLAFAFQCTPVRGYWVLSMWSERYCVNGRRHYRW